MTTGEKIKAARKHSGLTQKELGEKLGISQSAIGQFENESSNPSLKTIRKIATALDVPLSELVDNWNLFTPEEYKEDLSDFGNGFYGKEVTQEVQEKFKSRIFSRKSKMSHKMDLLNDSGQDMALDLVELVTKIPEYQKSPEE